MDTSKDSVKRAPLGELNGVPSGVAKKKFKQGTLDGVFGCKTKPIVLD